MFGEQGISERKRNSKPTYPYVWCKTDNYRKHLHNALSFSRCHVSIFISLLHAPDDKM